MLRCCNSHVCTDVPAIKSSIVNTEDYDDYNDDDNILFL